MHLLVPTETGETPHVTTPPQIIIIGVPILAAMVLLLLVIIISISAGFLIGRLDALIILLFSMTFRKRGKKTIAQVNSLATNV